MSNKTSFIKCINQTFDNFGKGNKKTLSNKTSLKNAPELRQNRRCSTNLEKKKKIHLESETLQKRVLARKSDITRKEKHVNIGGKKLELETVFEIENHKNATFKKDFTHRMKTKFLTQRVTKKSDSIHLRPQKFIPEEGEEVEKK